MKKLKILMLEDNQLDAKLIKEELTEKKLDFTSEQVKTEKDFIVAIHDFKPDIILSNYNLPQFTGFEALKIAKKLIPDIPFIIVTGSLSEEMAADSIKKGAWDYVLKENLIRLTSAIENALKLKEEKDKNKQAEEKEKTHHKNIQLLSKTAIQFVEFPQDKDIYTFIGEQLQELIGKDSYVIVNSTDTESKVLTVRAIIGMGKLSEKVANLIGKNPVGMTFDVEDERFVYLFDGKLHSYKESLSRITLKIIPETVSKLIEKLLNIKSIFTISLIKDNKLFGTFIILVKENTGELKNKQLIETFIKQASIAVQKRQAEDALRESEEQYRTLTNALPQYIYHLDKDLKYVSANKAYCESYGKLNEELIGKTSSDLFPEELAEQYMASDRKVIETGKIQEYIEKNRSIGEGEKWIKVVKVPIRNEKGDVIGMTGIYWDITERKQAEETLRESEEKYRLLTETANDFIILHDMNGQILYVNRAAVERIGYSYNESIKMTLKEIIPKDRIEQLFENRRKREKKDFSRLSFEIEIITKEGEKIPLEVMSSPFIKDGEVTAFFIIARDITERKKAEVALQESEEKYRLLADNSMDMIWQMDLKMVFTYISPSVINIMGYTVEELVGTGLSKHASTKEFFRVAKKALSAIKHYKKFKHLTFETVLLRKDGTEIPVEITSQLLFSKRGLPIGLQGSTRDITERKQAEEQITKDLKIKTALLQELYHRTKNNMAVISSMLSMQSRRSDNEFVITTFKEISNKIRAMSLVHNKLYKSKDLSNINLKEYIEDLTKLIMQSYGVFSERINIKFDMQDVIILIDSAIPLGLIINELISNIFKHAFTDNREGEIFIKLQKEKDETINLELYDNGVGFSQSFDPRKDGSMGLTTVFSIVENQLKGEVSVVSKNGLKWHIKIKDNLNKARV